MNFVLTRANVDDREESVIDTLTDKAFGKLYADKGYISQSLFGHLWDNGVHIVTGLRSNMKQRLLPLYDKIIDPVGQTLQGTKLNYFLGSNQPWPQGACKLGFSTSFRVR